MGTHKERASVSLFCGASLAAIVAVAAPSAASAQTADPQGNAPTTQPAQQDSALAASSESRPLDQSDIVVTGSRVVRDGFNAPTPTSVIGATEIAAKAPANIADFVNELPSVAGSATPRSTGSFVGGGLIGINALNLRNLNPNRTLILLDGQRVGSSTLTGLVDINQFPQQLVNRMVRPR